MVSATASHVYIETQLMIEFEKLNRVTAESALPAFHHGDITNAQFQSVSMDSKGKT